MSRRKGRGNTGPVVTTLPTVPDWNVSDWFGVVVGFASLGWGFWARSHPKRTRLRTRVRESPIGFPDDPGIQVLLNGDPVDQPVLVEIDVEHVGGEEIDVQRGDAIRFESPPEAGGRVIGLLRGSANDAELSDFTVSLKPRIFKVGEKASLSLMAEGMPRLVPFVRIARVEHVSDEVERRRALWRMAVSTVLAFGSAVAAFASVSGSVTVPPNPQLFTVAVLLIVVAVGVSAPEYRKWARTRNR